MTQTDNMIEQINLRDAEHATLEEIMLLKKQCETNIVLWNSAITELAKIYHEKFKESNPGYMFILDEEDMYRLHGERFRKKFRKNLGELLKDNKKAYVREDGGENVAYFEGIRIEKNIDIQIIPYVKDFIFMDKKNKSIDLLENISEGLIKIVRIENHSATGFLERAVMHGKVVEFYKTLEGVLKNEPSTIATPAGKYHVERNG